MIEYKGYKIPEYKDVRKQKEKRGIHIDKVLMVSPEGYNVVTRLSFSDLDMSSAEKMDKVVYDSCVELIDEINEKKSNSLLES